MPYLRKATDNPFGFIPYDQVLRIGKYRKNATTGKIWAGDLVIIQADGNVATAGTATGSIILGVAVASSASNSADTAFMVYDHPDQRFTVQDDGDTTQIAETNIGNLADITGTGGNDTVDRSTHELDSSSAAANGSLLALKIMGLHPIEADSFATTTGQQRKWVVMINPGKHFYATTSGV